MRKAASARFPGGKLPSLNFQDYSETFIEGVGTEIIRMKIETDQGVEALLEKWKTNKSRYPYFTLYMRAITYVMYYAEVEQNASIDWNTLTDIYLLGVVKDLDLIVSDDQKFMRSAFHALYPSCKEYIRLDEFLSRM
jgi:hypothetical protein